MMLRISACEGLSPTDRMTGPTSRADILPVLL